MCILLIKLFKIFIRRKGELESCFLLWSYGCYKISGRLKVDVVDLFIFFIKNKMEISPLL